MTQKTSSDLKDQSSLVFLLYQPWGFETGYDTTDVSHYCPLKAILVLVGMTFLGRMDVRIPKQYRLVSIVSIY